MAQGYVVPQPQRIDDTNGVPAVGWKVATFTATGTYTVPLVTYSDAGLTSANTNPTITDASGYYRMFVAADVQLDVQVSDDTDVVQYTWPSIKPMASGFEDGATLTDAVLISPTLSSVTNSDVKVLAADATATSNAALTSLTGFSWTLVAGATYAFRIRGKVGMTVNGGLAMAFKYTTATIASIAVSATLRTASVFAETQSTTVTDQTKFINSKAAAYIDAELEGSLIVTLGGTLALQFAQETSHSDTTTVYKGLVGEFVRTS